MSKIKDFFGLYTKRNDVDWQKVLREQQCPYTGKKCVKVRKSNPSVSIGVCTVNYSKFSEVMICPHRLLERRQIFTDCVHLLTLHEPGNELHLLPEVAIPGGSVDYFLVSVHNEKVVDFVGIELQTLDTTGSLWSERAALLSEKGLHVKKEELSAKTFGMNWKMSAKTILIQMHHKIHTFEHLDKHLVLVIQECFRDYMSREFSFSHMQTARQGDSFHIHSYSLDEVNNMALKLHLSNRISTDANGIAQCLGLQAEAKVDLDRIISYIQARISEKTLFTPV
ncbi:MAG: hypothetical protein LBM18_06220 [Oscillospiraceae bacterium]|jgi:hypothetical protein|nr:hypothetical protein [Oscillospiraceae bacterium]